MNNDRIEGNWKEMKGKVQQQWGKLTDDDLDVIDGRREELVGKIQQAWTAISIRHFTQALMACNTRKAPFGAFFMYKRI